MKTIISMYHDVNDVPESSGFTGAGANSYKYSKENFAKHLKKISENLTSPPITIFDLKNLNSSHAYMITFDDGGSSAYEVIANMLEQYGWHGHFLIATNYIDKNGFLKKEQIIDLDRRGHVIGSHSDSHPEFITKMSFKDIKNEWERSIYILESILNKKVNVASIPRGHISKNVVVSAYDAGIKYLMTSEPERKIKFYNDMMILGRYTMFNYKDEIFAGKLAAGNAFTLLNEYIYWNIKKLAKKSSGKYYNLFREKIIANRTAI